MKKYVIYAVVVAFLLVGIKPVYGHINIGKIIDWLDRDVEDTVSYEVIPYKTVDDEMLNIYYQRPRVNVYEDIPLVIFVHGGGFVSGSPSSVSSSGRMPVIEHLLDSGYGVASVEYRLLDGDTVFPSNIEDLHDAVSFIYTHGESFHIDLDNIGIWGVSAGGHLALMTGLNETADYELQYIINQSGPTDFESWLMNERDESRVSMLFDQDRLESDSSYLMNLSPINYVTEDSIPTLTLHGTSDETVPVTQAYLLDETFAENNNIYHSLSIFEGEGHSLNKEHLQTNQLIIDFIEATYQ